MSKGKVISVKTKILTDVFIATPKSKPFADQYVQSILLCEKPPMGTFFWNYVDGQAVSIARNLLVERFLQTKANFILFADSDAVWGTEAITRLYSRNLPMVSGIIFKRSLPPYPTMGKNTGKNIDDNHVYNFSHIMKEIVKRCDSEGADLTVENTVVFPESIDDIMDIDGCGAHFMLVRRDVIEALDQPYFNSTSLNAGEDFYFCRKVKAAGFDIAADLSVFTGHAIGNVPFDYGLREFLAFYKYSKDLQISVEDFAV